MDARSFETLTRRASLLTLGGAALAAAVAAPGLTSAKKRRKRKKAGKVCKRKEKKRCKKDAAACRQTIALICELTPAQCLAAQTCCDPCQAAGLLTCIAAASGSA